ncbi:hypothetical protein BT63DRAFT_227387 [Microthyrium microscopicum]|uniref:Yeast cell wall synthesis Kre9/Knh1-like N-terminal domain-containing protein n=1 Tax=Microthyrium microscopicum TaxID=703497 RepID=A0A6A6UCJ2_9PEZI|nr:hypothetical protein BT63DRAFT_227387 [Microthyrium microscopicum]
MRLSVITPFLALAASVTAIMITSPASGTDTTQTISLDLSTSQDITWTSVSTDPTSFELLLVSVNAYPVTSTVIATSVSTSDGKYSLKPQTDVTVGGMYRINFVNATSGAIMAQSGQFTVSKKAGSSSSSASSSATSSTSSGSSKATGASSTMSTATGSSASASASASSTSATSKSAGSMVKGCGEAGLIAVVFAAFLF